VLKIIPAAMVCRGMVSFKIHALLVPQNEWPCSTFLDTEGTSRPYLLAFYTHCSLNGKKIRQKIEEEEKRWRRKCSAVWPA
jgi:hypothetical protein